MYFTVVLCVWAWAPAAGQFGGRLRWRLFWGHGEITAMNVQTRLVLGTAGAWLAIQVLVIGALFPGEVRAQADEEIETIVVTARKREESLQEVPVSVSAFTEQTLLDRQIETIEDIAKFTPGLSFAKAFGRTTERPVIRGLGNVLAGVQFGVESGAAYFVDGVYYPGDLQSLNIQDIERIEVIRGPQSALYGRNTYSGAINFVTRSPEDVTEGETGFRFGQDGETQLTAGASGQLIDGVLGASVNARYYSFDGQYTNIVTGETVGDEETSSVSGVLDWKPSEALRIRTRLSVQSDDDGTRAFFLQPSESNNCFPGTRSNAAWPISGSTNNNQYFCGEINRPAEYVQLNDGPALPGQPVAIPGVPDTPFPGNFVFGIPGGDPYNPQQGVVFSGVERDLFYGSALAEYSFGDSGYSLIGSAAYRDEDRKTGSDSDHTSVNFLAGNPPAGTRECALCASERDDFEDYSFELRLESPQAERLRWFLGAFFYDQDIDGSDVTYANPDGGPVNEQEETENWAAFASVEFDFTERITGTVEGRYFDEEKSLFQDATVNPSSGIPVFDESVDFDEFAPRATINWQAFDDVMLYAIYAKGYKPGGLNGKAGLTATNPAPTYGQEESDNFEVGAKSTWLDGRLTANLAMFFIDVDDIQLTTPLATGTGQLTSIVTNQGSGEVKGGEIELALAITDDLRFSLNYALADTEFTEGCDEFQWTLTSGGGLLTDFANCTGNNVNGNGNGSIDGKQFPLSSRNQLSAAADYRRAVADGLDLFVNADISWEDEKPVQVHNLAWVPDATLVNAQVGVDTGRMVLSFYGRNLTDEDAPAMVTRWLQDPLVITAAGFPDTAAAGAPVGACPPGTCSTSYPRAFFGDMRRGRNFGIELTYKFGGDE
jgi:outer membrane receptor protein involved in Fe transport